MARRPPVPPRASSRADSIDFLDVAQAGPASDRPEHLSRSNGRRPAVMLMLAIGMAFVGLSALQSDHQLPSAPTVPVTVGVEGPVAVGDDEQLLPAFVAWPRPPADHDPYLLRAPGPGRPLVEGLADAALIYVNTLGRVSIIDLATGDRDEVEISASRSGDSFFVEFGQVVTMDPQNASWSLGGDRAFEVSVGRRRDSEVMLLGLGPLVASDSFELVDVAPAERESDAIATLLGAEFVADGRWLAAFDFRVPAPAESTAVLLVRQPRP